MRFVDLLHRWCGGVIGLLLALLGASGTLLIHEDGLFRPAVTQVGPAVPLAGIVRAAAAEPGRQPRHIVFASSEAPVHKVIFADGSGRYLDAGGATVARWRSMWGRPELWLLDFHRHLFLGDAGETLGGIGALLGMGFVFTGVLLWWQRRRTFAFRLLPARLSRPAILRHHRDLGIVVAPLLLLSFVTGAVMALKPVGLALVSPWSSAAEIAAATAAPPADPRPPAVRLDWAAILRDCRRRFPTAEPRMIGFPRKPGDPVLVRMRLPEEWLPNGRTSLWYSAHDGHLIAARSARTRPQGARILDLAYPLHAARVGGLPYTLLMTVSGIGLTLLGSLAVWSFWFRKPRARPRRAADGG